MRGPYRNMKISGTTSVRPSAREAAASAPRIPAHPQLPARARRMHPSDRARNSDSVYTAENAQAIGEKASRSTRPAAASAPSSSAASRYSRTRATAKDRHEIRIPAARSEPTTAPTPLISSG